MADDVVDAPQDGRRFPISVSQSVALLLLVLLLLFGAYWVFLRTTYVPIYEGLAETDAAAVVAELEERKIGHRLANGGTTILVGEGDADAARLSIASSDLPLRGQIGFELFNDSDMGLTEFAQKINYQRALQGELSRTIMLLDGIENARVHLALPERTLFRGARTEPTAAITLMLQPGHVITAARIGGIQRLVAAAVPDLDVSAVAIVDDSGQLISATAPVVDAGTGETDAVRLYYRARIANAIATVAPTIESRVDVRVIQRVDVPLDSRNPPASAGDLAGDRGGADTAAARQQDVVVPASQGSSDRNYALNITITNPVQLSTDTRDQVSRAVIDAAQLNRDRQDRLSFAVGPIVPANMDGAAMPGATTVVSRQPAAAIADYRDGLSWGLVSAMAFFMALGGGLLTYLVMRRNAASPVDPVEDFAAQLRARLAQEEPAHG